MSEPNAYLLDLSSHGRIRATGDDRARLLHALTTNHIQQLKPGGHAYAFFLTAQGRIIADAHILCFEDSLLIDTEPETRATLLAHIDHYIIADDVALEDETAATFSVGVEGPGAGELVSRVAPDHLTLVPISATGAGGFRIYGPLDRRGEVWHSFLAAGAIAGNLHALRVEHFRPRYGEDITDKTLPQETGLPNALHFQKGCYLGQEIVERIRSQGQVHRILSGLEFDASEAPPPGTEVFAEETAAGKITSSSGRFAIARLRVLNAKPGTALSAPAHGPYAVTKPIPAA